jgi:hypothetical protein
MRPSPRCSFILAALCLTSCDTKPEEPSTKVTISAEEAVAKANASARRAHLQGDLEAAGVDTKKIARVYTDAVELNDSQMQQLADQKLSDLMIPQAQEATWDGTFRRLLRIAPDGSRTEARIKAIASTKHLQ